MAGFPELLLSDVAALIVVAPHPDDDILGCGALLAATAAGRIPVTVVYVTDGAASHAGSAQYPPARLRDLREREALRALRRLGVGSQPHFLRCRDGDVPAPGDVRERPLLDALRDVIPAAERVAVAVPWRRDPHADHRAVARLAATVLGERPRARRLEYAVWLAARGDGNDAPRPGEGRAVEFDSRPWLAAKRAALREHRSQLGRLITDATRSFALPDELLAAALGPYERFIVDGPIPA